MARKQPDAAAEPAAEVTAESQDLETQAAPEAAPEAPAPAKASKVPAVYRPADFGYSEGEQITDLHHLNLIGKPK